MTTFTESYDKDNHYLCKEASLPTLTPGTILDMANYNWFNRILDDDPAILKNFLTILNVCDPPTNTSYHRNYVEMQTNLANSQIEEALVRHLEHSRSKTMDSFVR